MKKYFYLIILLIAWIRGITQPAIQWKKALGGVGFDEASTIRQTSDGGYIISGNASSRSGDVTGIHSSILGPVQPDAWIVKLDNNSNLQWQKCLGSSLAEYAKDILQTPDGGYIVAATTSAITSSQDPTGNHGGTDFWIVKLSDNGTIQWQKCYGGSSDEYAYSIQSTIDGGWIVAGSAASNNGDVSGNQGAKDFWIIKIDNAGLLQWQKTLGGSLDDVATAVQPTPDGGYIVTGYSNSINGNVSGHHGNKTNFDYWVVKLNSTGNLQWQKSLGGAKDDAAMDITITTDGGFCIAGYSYSNSGDISGHHGSTSFPDFWIVKLSHSGSIQWQRPLGGNGADFAKSLQQTSDGGYIVSGSSSSTNGDVTGFRGGSGDYWVVKLNNNGNIQWQKTLGGTQTDSGNSVIQASDGGFVVAGHTLSNDIDVTGNHGLADYWVIKFDASLGRSNKINNEIEIPLSAQVYPNPASDQVSFHLPETPRTELVLSIYNLQGLKMIQTEMRTTSKTIALKDFRPGIYFYKIYDRNKITSEGKFIVQ